MVSRVRVGVGVALVGLVVSVVGIAGAGTTQAASVSEGTVAVIGNTPYSSLSKQCDPSPNRDGWHVIMNGLTYPSGATITAADFGPVNLTFSDGSTGQALFTDLSGNPGSTAHFLDAVNNQTGGPFTITAASMTFPAGTDITGYNNFIISHPPCGVNTTTTTTSTTTTTTTLPPTTTTSTTTTSTTTTSTTTTSTTTTTTLPPTTTVPPPVFDLTAESFCKGNVPYLKYLVTENGQPTKRAVEVQLTKLNVPTGVQPSAGGFSGGGSGEFLWPGAAVDSQGNAIDWPGWKLVNGEWVAEQDYLRPNLQFTATLVAQQGTERAEVLMVDGSASLTVSYPPATAACADPPRTESNPPTTTTTVASTPRIPSTGSNSNTMLVVGLMLTALGAVMALLGIRKRPTN